MPFWRAYYHIVWATKNRQPWIAPQVEPRLFAYLVAQAVGLGAYVYAIGGTDDHVHLVATIPPSVSVSHFVKQLKGASAHDLNQHAPDFCVSWQRGYGVLTLGQRQRAVAEDYVRGQKQHHAQGMAQPWLERTAEVDEGPPDTGVGRPDSIPGIAEKPQPYGLPGEAPF